MLRIFLLAIILAITSFILACASTPQANSNANTNIVVVANSGNTSPNVSATPMASASNLTVGVPVNAVNSPTKGATPTPGFPDPKLANRMVKPGATPTPGIPDKETIRRQMQGLETPNGNANPNLAPPGGGMMMKKRPRPVNKPQ